MPKPEQGARLPEQRVPNENERMRKMLDDLLAKLEQESTTRQLAERGSQARFADEMDSRILDDEGASAREIQQAQRERQLPSERQAADISQANGSSADELANYAMIKRGQRMAPKDDTAGFNRRFREAPPDDNEGFAREFQGYVDTQRRMKEMFGRPPMSEAEKARVMAEMQRGADREVARIGARPVTPVQQSGGGLDEAALDEAARRERGFRY